MYTGHIAIALGARGLKRDLPLWVLVLSTQACDWLEITLRWSRLDLQSEVYSHAFPFVLVGAAGAAAAVWLWKRSSGAALTVLIIYLSHPLADYITSSKPLWFGGANMGLLITDHPTADFVIQGLLCIVGVILYSRSSSSTRGSRISAVLMLIPLLTLQALSDVTLSARAHGRSFQHATTNAVMGPLR